MQPRPFACNACSDVLRALNTTLPLPQHRLHSVNPAASNAALSAGILQFIGHDAAEKGCIAWHVER